MSLRVYLVGLYFHLVSGLEECQVDSDCFSPDVYCLDGYCDGHCIPCKNFLRQPPYSGGCAKNKEDCGSCVPGAAPEEHVGFQHAFRCEMIHESVPVDSGMIPQWLAWTAIGLASVLFVWVVFRCIRRIRRIRRTKKSNIDRVMLQQMLP
ncbi:hypothetical protein GHT06_013602 [Daphnia sinensis]|uniref:TNFR-Cys domain-containing protein n=1 Tax=Daphnia sinensis TaxID=1820382 RepID=A0AAD5KV02_9CRUS|nr:hypothetical protein GHT06_013602 [Daphnia sinensis]